MTKENKVETFRWLFYLSLFQLLACLTLPLLLFPGQVRFSIELLVVLTVGLLFGLYFMGVSIYGLFIDKTRRTIYSVIIILISLWVIGAILTWIFIERMPYLT